MASSGVGDLTGRVLAGRYRLLAPIGAGASGRVYVADDVRHLLDTSPGSVAVSAATGEGIDDLLNAVSDRLRALERVVELLVPWDRGDVLARLHRDGEVLVEAPQDDAMRVRARLDAATAGRYREWTVAS